MRMSTTALEALREASETFLLEYFQRMASEQETDDETEPENETGNDTETDTETSPFPILPTIEEEVLLCGYAAQEFEPIQMTMC